MINKTLQLMRSQEKIHLEVLGELYRKERADRKNCCSHKTPD